MLIYLLIVIVTTPNLSPINSIRIALQLNWWLITGVSVGTGVQTFLVTFSKEKACNFRAKKPITGVSGVSSVFSSFTSFIALTHVGCCGTWLYILSFLPGIIGTGTTSFLIDYGGTIGALGLIFITLSTIYTFLSIRRRFHSNETHKH
jgi:hypothetical protein